MTNLNKENFEHYSVEFKASGKNKWIGKKLAELENSVQQIIQLRSPERKLKNEMLSIKYRMEALKLSQNEIAL